ncbi:uncharacterized protein LOC142980493 [Anticarsia gemmatalis]|uniref:uncharacterized protein LOC142980493 n=1 Tax=Anticarsia gemmatalis TaxID=129554 RepID=UPI003F7758EE
MSVTNQTVTMPRDVLSEQQCNIEFVKTVQKYPCLYNYELPAYTRKDISDSAWEEVAEATNMTPSACRERWRNLRAVFMRTIKATGAGTKKKPYYLAEVMQFIVPYLRPTTNTEPFLEAKKQQLENSRKDTKRPSLEIELEEIKVENLDDDISIHSNEWTIESTTSTRKRPQEIEEERYPNPPKRPPHPPPAKPSIGSDHDQVASFINSLMPELREMNSAQFKCFKRRVLVLIDDITTEIPSTSHNDDYSMSLENAYLG